MDINATIVAQALNFFVVYWMLRQFLFRPIIGIIEYENTKECALRDIIAQQKKSLEIQHKERQRHWYICQEYFNIHRPHLTVTPIALSDTTDEITATIRPSQEHINQMISSMSKTVEDTIKNVH